MAMIGEAAAVRAAGQALRRAVEVVDLVLEGGVHHRDADLATDADGDAGQVDEPEADAEVAQEVAACPGFDWPAMVRR